MKKIKELFIKYKEIIMYIIFGVLTTLVNWVVYAATQPLLKAAMHGDQVIWTLFGKNITMNVLAIFLANLISWIAAVLFAYVTNKLWVFESKSWKFSLVMKELWLFILARLITGVIEWVFVPLLAALGLDTPVLGIDGFIPKLIVSIVVIILNYVFSKLIIFRKKKKPEETEKSTEA